MGGAAGEGVAAAGFSAAGGAATGGFSGELEMGLAGGTTFSAVGLLSPSGGGGAGGLVSSAILLSFGLA